VTCRTHGNIGSAYRILAIKPERRQRGSPRSRWEDNIKEVCDSGLDLNCSGLGPMAGSCEHDNEPQGFIKG
jgi:hypothetical protein